MDSALPLEPLVIVLFCTLIQNIFGVGILVFGTPLLLALDYDLFVSLGLLLPCSFIVSLIQVFTIKGASVPATRILFISAIGVAVGVIILNFFAVTSSVYIVTAFAMFFSGLLRVNERFRKLIETILNYKQLQFYLLNGIFHGFSNLGGILLVLKSSVETNHRNQFLVNTAAVYIIYVTCQATVLSLSGKMDVFGNGVTIAPAAGLLSYILGQRPLSLLSRRQLDLSLGLFFTSVGLILVYKTIQF